MFNGLPHEVLVRLEVLTEIAMGLSAFIISVIVMAAMHRWSLREIPENRRGH